MTSDRPKNFIVFFCADQGDWDTQYCQNGKRQSPIDIPTHSDEVKYVGRDEWDPFRFIRFYDYPR